MKSRRYTLLAVLVLSAANCGTNEHSASKDAALERLVATYPCSSRLPPISDSSGDSLSIRERCALVAAALEAMKTASPHSGVLPGDTADITLATLTPLSLADSVGTVLHSYWIVSFSLRGQLYDGEVWFDRHTGAATVRRTHKPIGRSA